MTDGKKESPESHEQPQGNSASTGASIGPDQIGPASSEVTESDLAKQQLAHGDKPPGEIEPRTQLLANNLVEQKHKLQQQIFYVVLTVIIVFFIVFLLTVVNLVCTEKLLKKEFPATATVLVAMMGSIPTILTGFLLVGLFSHKDSKDGKEKDEKGLVSDIGSIAKSLADIAKYWKPH